jgi:glycosyltransferase involved in cell wall biosynthesis
MEAASAGCLPILPRRLVYPELFDEPGFFYDGSVQDLTNRLMELARAKDEGTFWSAGRERAMQLARQYAWDRIAPRLDTAVEQVIANS